MSQQIREEVLELMKQKDKIEDEIKELTSILTQNGVGMDDPLVDSNGFPINSIDIYQVRHARHKIIYLQNDYKALMKKIENGLQGYYNATSSQSIGVHDIEMKSPDTTQIVTHNIPFVKVTQITLNSPAELAGLQNNDLIVEFGSINSTNFKNIGDIANVVQYKEDGKIRLKVKREEKYITLQLVPKKWSGKGLLGCNIHIL